MDIIHKTESYAIMGACFEIKAVSELTDEHRAQVHDYLKATGFKLGLLVNSGHFPKAAYERIVR